MKLIFKKHIKKEVPSVLKSYHLLTVFLWFMELKPMSFWDENQEGDTFKLRLNELLLFLCEHLDQNEIRHYFIKSLNLLENLTHDQEKEYSLPIVSKHIKKLVNSDNCFPR